MKDVKLLKPSEVYCAGRLTGSRFGCADMEHIACVVVAHSATCGDKWQQIVLSKRTLD